MTDVANLVYQTSTGTGTGNLTLIDLSGEASPEYFRNFSDAFGTGSGNPFYYCIRHTAAAEYEIGTGYMSDATTLVRQTVIESSNANSLVNFSAGTKDVINDLPSSIQSRLAGLDQSLSTSSQVEFDKLTVNNGGAEVIVVTRGETDANTAMRFKGATQDVYIGMGSGGDFAVDDDADLNGTPAFAVDPATGDGTFNGGLSVASDTLFVETSGGRVGVGTNTPSGLTSFGASPAINLVNTSSNLASIAIDTTNITAGFGADNNRMYMYSEGGDISISADVFNTDSSSRISFSVDGTEHMRVNTGGNVGIGDTTPDTKLEVDGAITLHEMTAPSTPNSGKGVFYVKTDGKPYFKNDAGTESDLTDTGSGGGFTPTVFQATKNSSTFTSTTSFADVTGFDEDINTGSDYTFNGTTGVLTFDTAGTYSISFHAVGDQSANSRQELQCKMQADTGAGFADVAGAFDKQYSSRNTAQDEGSAQFSNFMFAASVGDDIKFQMAHVGVAGVFGQDDVRISVFKLA